MMYPGQSIGVEDVILLATVPPPGSGKEPNPNICEPIPIMTGFQALEKSLSAGYHPIRDTRS
jgi:hypothetical protein